MTEFISTIDVQEGLAEFDHRTIKARLLTRFVAARDKIGRNWRIALARNDPFFDTRTGHNYAAAAARSVSQLSYGKVDIIERVTVALEKIAGIGHPSHAAVEGLHGKQDAGYISIRHRLLLRLYETRKIVGGNWKAEIKAIDPFFSTQRGESFILSVVQANSAENRISVDRLERVVVALEKVAGIPVTSVV